MGGEYHQLLESWLHGKQHESSQKDATPHIHIRQCESQFVKTQHHFSIVGPDSKSDSTNSCSLHKDKWKSSTSFHPNFLYRPLPAQGLQFRARQIAHFLPRAYNSAHVKSLDDSFPRLQTALVSRFPLSFPGNKRLGSCAEKEPRISWITMNTTASFDRHEADCHERLKYTLGDRCGSVSGKKNLSARWEVRKDVTTFIVLRSPSRTVCCGALQGAVCCGALQGRVGESVCGRQVDRCEDV